MNLSRVSIALAALLVLLHWALPALAEPVEAVLYPDGAQVREAATLPVNKAEGGSKATFQLPFLADPQSLAVRAAEPKVQIRNVRWERALRQDSEEIKRLREQIRGLEAERAGLKARELTLEAQVEFWRAHGKDKVSKDVDLASIAQIMAKNLNEVHRERLALVPRIEDMDKRLKELKGNLANAVGRRDEAWNVEVVLDGVQGQSVKLAWAYDVGGCGWTPLYRIEAKPAEKQVLFGFEAEAWQSTGRDWTSVGLSLATVRPSSAVSPPHVPDWIIVPEQKIQQPLVKRAARSMEVGEGAESMPAPAPAPMATPVRERQATFDLWRLGAKSMPAGARQRITIGEETWAASFTHLLRPSFSPVSFLRADITRSDEGDIPPGPAIFLVDSAVVGKREFSLTPDRKTVFFGTDQQVTARIRPLEKKSGEKGLFGSKQTYSWQWQIDLANGTAQPVKVRVEEPRPRVGDERIELAVEADPPALQPKPGDEDSDKLVWDLEVPKAGRSIRYSVSIKAPADMPLDLGWRR